MPNLIQRAVSRLRGLPKVQTDRGALTVESEPTAVEAGRPVSEQAFGTEAELVELVRARRQDAAAARSIAEREWVLSVAMYENRQWLAWDDALNRAISLMVDEDRDRYVTHNPAKFCDGSGLATTKDNYDRTITTYKGAKLRDIGRGADDTNSIIGSEETPTGELTNGNRTSIYAVRYGDTYCTGWHDGKMDLDYVGTDDTGTQDIWLLDYQAGVYHAHSRTIARLYGLQLTQ